MPALLTPLKLKENGTFPTRIILFFQVEWKCYYDPLKYLYLSVTMLQGVLKFTKNITHKISHIL
jgi:hypothetical protein